MQNIYQFFIICLYLQCFTKREELHINMRVTKSFEKFLIFTFGAGKVIPFKEFS